MPGHGLTEHGVSSISVCDMVMHVADRRVWRRVSVALDASEKVQRTLEPAIPPKHPVDCDDDEGDERC